MEICALPVRALSSRTKLAGRSQLLMRCWIWGMVIFSSGAGAGVGLGGLVGLVGGEKIGVGLFSLDVREENVEDGLVSLEVRDENVRDGSDNLNVEDGNVEALGEEGGVNISGLKSFSERISWIHFPDPVTVTDDIFTGWK